MRRRRISQTALVAAFTAGLASFAAHAAGDFQGSWQVKDSKGKPFEITLAQSGQATGTQRPNMTGTWKEEGNAAVISWNTGWTTKIEKQDGHYTHMAWGPGKSASSQPTDTSGAEKLK